MLQNKSGKGQRTAVNGMFLTVVLLVSNLSAAAMTGMPDKVEVDAVVSTNRTRRAFRDYPVKLDLSGKFAFAADVTVGCLSQFSGFDIQFRSGGGWYDFHFMPEKEGAPERIAFLLKDMKTEGTPR